MDYEIDTKIYHPIEEVNDIILSTISKYDNWIVVNSDIRTMRNRGNLIEYQNNFFNKQTELLGYCHIIMGSFYIGNQNIFINIDHIKRILENTSYIIYAVHRCSRSV